MGKPEKIEPVQKIEMKRKITLLNAVTITVGSVIGSGIFISPQGVLAYSGSVGLSLIIWSLCGVMSTIGALCFVELGTSISKSGGEFAYLMEAFGPVAAFLFLWVCMIVILPTTLAIVSLTFAQYAVRPFFAHCSAPQVSVEMLAAICLGLITFINCMSVRWAMRIQGVFTAAKLLALASIVVAGLIKLTQGQTQHFQEPFKGEVDLKAVSLAFYSGLFAFGGWNSLNRVVDEMKDPYKNLPRAIWIAMPLVTAVYVLANVAYMTVVSKDELLESPAVAVTFGHHVFGVMAWVIPVFVALSTFGAANGILFTSGRLLYMGAEAGHLPSILSMIHYSRLTPVPALLLTGFQSVLMIYVGNIFVLINYFSFPLWLFTAACIAGQIWLRHKRPDLPRPIRLPLILPISFLLCCSFLLTVSLMAETWNTGMGLFMTLSGIPVYFIFLYNNQTSLKLSASTEWFTIQLQKILLVLPKEREDCLLDKTNNIINNNTVIKS